jgi:rod shape-determining protein MreC
VRSLLRRYREPIFVALLLAGPFLVFAARWRPLPLQVANRAIVAMTAPVERALTLAVAGALDTWTGYVWLHNVRQANVELRRQLLRERQQSQRAAELLAENARLKGLLDYADKERPVRMLPATVVAVGASPHSHSLRIARGSNDGVQRGAAVVSQEGVVGTVAQITAAYADVQLITSPLSAVPALSQRTRSRSTVRGTGDITRARLEYALRSDDLQDGDLLLTAGGAGFFPKGLHIGRVANVQRRATGMFLGADVLPAVDFSRLDEVMVVISDPGAPAEPDGGVAPTSSASSAAGAEARP